MLFFILKSNGGLTYEKHQTTPHFKMKTLPRVCATMLNVARNTEAGRFGVFSTHNSCNHESIHQPTLTQTKQYNATVLYGQ